MAKEEEGYGMRTVNQVEKRNKKSIMESTHIAPPKGEGKGQVKNLPYMGIYRGTLQLNPESTHLNVLTLKQPT